MEFWFTDIHFITVMGPILLGLVFAGGGGPNHHALSGENWRNPGRFTQYLRIEGSLGHFLEFWAVLVQSAFSYIGSRTLEPKLWPLPPTRQRTRSRRFLLLSARAESELPAVCSQPRPVRSELNSLRSRRRSLSFLPRTCSSSRLGLRRALAFSSFVS